MAKTVLHSSTKTRRPTGRKRRGTELTWIAPDRAGCDFEDATSIRLASVRRLASRQNPGGWDAWLFVEPSIGRRPRSADPPDSPTPRSIANATERLAEVVRFERHVEHIRSHAAQAGVEAEAPKLARTIAGLLGELGLAAKTSSNGPVPNEEGSPRGRMLLEMLDYGEEQRRMLVQLAADLDAAVRIHGPEAYTTSRERHRPGRAFGWVCRKIAEALVEAGLAPDGRVGGREAVGLASLFVAAMGLAPRTKASHRGDHLHLPRLRGRVKQAINRSW